MIAPCDPQSSAISMVVAAPKATKTRMKLSTCSQHVADATCSGVFVSTKNLFKGVDESNYAVEDATSSTSICSSMSNVSSTSSCWGFSDSSKRNKNVPLLVTDPDSKEPIQDEAAALGSILARSRNLPGISLFASNHIMVNQERTSRLTAPLTRLRELDEFAREHAEEMAAQGRLFHSCPTEIQYFLYHRTSRRLGENVARGCCLNCIHKAMMKSRSDKSNILDRRYCTFGMASVRGKDGLLYVCQVYRG